ncbi:MAG: DUF2752 domain-containing protein [bacterium]
MQVKWRRAQPHDQEPYLALVLAALALLAIAIAHLPESWIPACKFHLLTGWPCPSCGMTRAMRLLVGGQLAEAFREQPLMVLLCCTAALVFLYSVTVSLLRQPRLRITAWPRAATLAVWALLLSLVLTNWWYLIHVAV